MTESNTGPGGFVGLPPLGTIEEIRDWIEEQGIATETLGTNFAGQPLLLASRSGGQGRPIVISAGAHAGEPAGVLAALLLLRDYEFKCPVYFVPVRDPFAWQGYGKALEHALGQSVPELTDHAQVEQLLRDNGKELHDEDGLLIVDVNGIAFATMLPTDPPMGPRQLEQAVNAAMRKRPELVPLILGKRIVFPSNSVYAEGVRNFDRAFSATIRGEGIVADMNRGFGGQEEPAEVEKLRELVDRLEPALVLDLHEGQGSTHYVFVGADSEHTELYDYAQQALDAMAEGGLPPVTLPDLVRTLGPGVKEGLTEPSPGMMVGRVQNNRLAGTSFGNYCDRYCAAITTETGRWSPLKQRVETQLRGARAVLDAYQASLNQQD